MRKRQRINQWKTFNQIKKEIHQFATAYTRGVALDELSIYLKSLNNALKIKDTKYKYLEKIRWQFKVDSIISILGDVKIKIEKNLTLQNPERQNLLETVNDIISKFTFIRNCNVTSHSVIKSKKENKKILTYHRKLFKKCDQALKDYNKGRITSKEVVDALGMITRIKVNVSNSGLLIPIGIKFKKRQIPQRILILIDRLTKDQSLEPEIRNKYINSVHINRFKCRSIIKIAEQELK